ncbi:MAG TPA: major capsid protein [Anaerolineae bacterium]|nr:major capsid protein [Anaerolineae bacterium]
MPQPGVGDVHVKKLLTNISVAYKNPLYIAERIAPIVLVDRQSDIIPLYTKSYWARSVAQKTSPMQPPPIGGYEVGNDTYFCEERSVGDIIPDAQQANQDPPFNALADSTEWVTDQLLLEHEIGFLTDFWKTGVWGTDMVGGADFTKWSTYATSTPIQDLREWKRTIRRALLGRSPNRLVLGDLTFDVLADHPNLLDRVKYSSSNDSPAMVTPNLLAQLIGLDEVMVGSVIYTTDPEGTDEDSITYTAGYDDDAFMAYVAPHPGRRLPSALYTFVWSTLYGGTRYIRQRREPLSDKGWLIEGFTHYTIKGLAPDAGLFISDAVD